MPRVTRFRDKSTKKPAVSRRKIKAIRKRGRR